MDIQAPRGVRDILPDESWKWAYVLNSVAKVMADFGHSEIHLPIFENTELFSRGVGETTDIVEKEMYTFTDRGSRSLTLRPEATAGMVRAALEHGMCSQNAAARLWCWGPMFRYERPQKGRYRQFFQIDAEVLGIAGPAADVDTIALSVEMFRRLALRGLRVALNSVGCPQCRPAYRDALLAYFGANRDALCETCQARLERNPLRVLDCKSASCSAVADAAPAIYDHLCPECAAHFDEVKSGLARLGLPFSLDKRLVRGLDYYTKTAYEIISGDLSQGAQNAVCGGGRYDNLAESIGGPHTPGVGFAAGIDRIVLVMEEQNCSFGKRAQTEVYIVARDDASRPTAQVLAGKLRSAGISAAYDAGDSVKYARSFKAQMKSALSARWQCIIEANGTFTLSGGGSDLTLTEGELVNYIEEHR
ncbi:MAG: histidine--tRNA ligase [Synergistaceae bacterium]|jgi:histidyl-tRNA synthetase|nr:histidine--tRNA ligase [Synergistaceae bacterium]